MKLTTVEVRNFRSIRSSTNKDSLRLALSHGPNVIVGPNNSGKTNLFAAIEMGLTRGANFDGEIDLPSFLDERVLRNVKPSIELGFRLEGRKSSEMTLLGHVQRLAVQRGVLFRKQDEFRLRVKFERRSGQWIRSEDFLLGGVSDRASDAELLAKALDSFWFCLRFIRVSSGGKVDEASVWRLVSEAMFATFPSEYQELSAAFANLARRFDTELADPMSAKLTEVMQKLFPGDLRSVRISVPLLSINELLEGTSLEITDESSSGPDEKGSGVKSGYQLAVMNYLADSVGRSLVLLIDEPESFLHPGAQRRVVKELELLASRQSVTLLYSTHSPYVVSRRSEAKIFRIEKVEGRTRLLGSTSGADNLTSVFAPLFDSIDIGDVVKLMGQLRLDSDATIVVEGMSDKVLLEAAVAKLNMSALGNIDFFEANGARNALYWGILINALQAPRPVLVLLDKDAPHHDGSDALAEKVFRALNGEMGISKSAASKDRKSNGVTPHRVGRVMQVSEIASRIKRLQDRKYLDIEDLFPPYTYRRFASATLRPELISPSAIDSPGDKQLFSNWVAEQGQKRDFKDIGLLLSEIQRRLQLGNM